MPCEPFCYIDENGDVFSGIMCSRGKRNLCHYCGRPSTSLCDYPIAGGGTCDNQICDRCKTTIGKNMDVCRKHNSKECIEKTLKAGKKHE